MTDIDHDRVYEIALDAELGVTHGPLDTIRIYRDSLGEYRWTRRTPTGHTINESTHGWPTLTQAGHDAETCNPDTHLYRREDARD